MLCHLLTKLELTASASMAQRLTDDCVSQWVKDGGTALELHHCGTVSCDLFLWSAGVKMSEAGDAQQAQRFVVQGGSFAPW